MNWINFRCLFFEKSYTFIFIDFRFASHMCLSSIFSLAALPPLSLSTDPLRISTLHRPSPSGLVVVDSLSAPLPCHALNLLYGARHRALALPFPFAAYPERPNPILCHRHHHISGECAAWLRPDPLRCILGG